MDTNYFDSFTDNGNSPQEIGYNTPQENSPIQKYPHLQVPPHILEEKPRNVDSPLTRNRQLHVIHNQHSFQSGHQHPPQFPKNHKKRHYHPGQNSLILETLTEISEELHDIATILNIITEIDPEAIILYEKIRARNITEDPKLFIQLMIAEEQTTRIKTIAIMADYIKRRKAIILLPLPPYLLNLIETAFVPELVFETEKRIQAHIKHIVFRKLNMNTLAEMIEQVDEIEALILDGQFRNNELLIRENAAPLLKIMLNKQLDKIFLHKIPYLPREEKFVPLNISSNNVEVTSI